MSNKQIINPLGAYGLPAEVSSEPSEFKASATIATTAPVVAIGTDYRVATAATDGTASLAIGVTLEAGIAGETVEVVTHGLVKAVPVAGAVAAGDTLKRSVTTAGKLSATATPATGETFGIALAASASNVVDVWVLK